MAKNTGGSRSPDNSSAKNLLGPYMTEEDKKACAAEIEHIKQLKELDILYRRLNYKDSYYARLVKESIIGQDENVDKIVAAIMANLHQNMMLDYYGEDAKRQSLLIIGPSGCGKTATVKKIAQVTGIPMAVCDATSLTSTGYIGGEVVNVIKDLIEAAHGNVEIAKRGIIYFDEIDKKKEGDTHNSSGRDINGTAIQEELLKYFDDNNIVYDTKKPPFPTRMLTIIMSGRFVGLEEFKRTRLQGPRILGFAEPKILPEDDPTIDDETFRQDYNPYDRRMADRYISNDIIKFGFLSEFAGRIIKIIEYRKLTRDDMIAIILSKDSILQQYYRTFKLKNHELYIDDWVFEKLADAAVNDETGARNLMSLLFEFLDPAIIDSTNHYGPGLMEYDEYGNYYSVFQNPKTGRIEERYVPVVYPERHVKRQP